MENEEKIKAYIIKTIVDKNWMTKENLNGVNDFLDELTEDTLEVIAEDFIEGY